MEPKTQIGPDRLDSWKEIAVYLDREVRTVRRWERREGMPVHRHLHGRRATVYAFKSEIDRWLQGRDRGPTQPALQRPSRPWQPGRLAKVGLTAVFMLIAGLLWTVLPDLISQSGRALDFHKRDWILIADLENRTSEPLFDTLRFALEEQLRQSRFVNVVPPGRIQDVLQLMRESAVAELDATLARQVCIRDGKIRHFLTGQVSDAANGYLLQLQIRAPETGLVAAHTTLELAGRAEIKRSVRELARWARQTLGEQSVEAAPGPRELEGATTPSLEALRLYSEGWRLQDRNQPGAARELFARAVQEDPGFASAYIALAQTTPWGDPDRRLELAQRAFDLSEGVSEREYFYIRGNYYSDLEESRKAIDAFEALLRLYPDDYRAVKALRYEYMLEGNEPKAADLSLRLAQLRPYSVWANCVAMTASAQTDDPGQWEIAARYAEQVVELLEEADQPDWECAEAFVFPAWEAWNRGDPDEVLAVVEQLIERHRSLPLRARGFSAMRISDLFLTLGMFEEAQKWDWTYYSRPDRGPFPAVEPDCHDFLIDLAEARQDMGLLESSTAGCFAPDAPFHSAVSGQSYKLVRMLMNGLDTLTEEQVVGLINREFDEGWKAGHVTDSANRQRYLQTVRALFSMARGSAGQAAAILQRELARLPSDSFRQRWLILLSQSLAEALELQGDLVGAVAVLEPIISERFWITRREGWRQLQLEGRLARLYRRLGHDEQAEALENHLRMMLAYADTDYPLLARLATSG